MSSVRDLILFGDRYWGIFIGALAAGLLICPSFAAPPPIQWDAKIQGSFVVSMCLDSFGRIWVGTEDMGVWCWDSTKAERELAKKEREAQQSGEKPSKEKTTPAPPGWTHYTRELTGAMPETNGPGITAWATCLPALGDDNAYAIACDKKGRIWVGHLNHGVSVFNGREWRNYDVIAGPIGERVFDIKVCPLDGDVWIATSAGLTRYRADADAWAYYTRADGLPSDQIQCMAFSENGTLYAGTQCDGLAVCEPDGAPERTDAPQKKPAASKNQQASQTPDKTPDQRPTKTTDKAPDKTAASTPQATPKSILEYRDWRHVTTPGNSYTMPIDPLGDGIPSNLINDILVAKNGAIYVATNTGLARSDDNGETWSYVRGDDWEVKDKGLYNRPEKERFDAARKIAARARDKILLEDFCTCLAEDTKGRVWVGHRDKPFEVIDPEISARVDQDKEQANPALDGFVKVILALPKSTMLIAKYGGGSKKLEKPLASRPSSTSSSPPLPSPAKPPTAEELAALLSRLKAKSPVALGERAEGAGGEGGASNARVSRVSVEKTSDRPKMQNCFLGDDWMTWGDWIGRYGRQFNVLCAAATPFDHDMNWGNHYAIERKIDEQYGQNGKDCLRGWIQWAETRNRKTLYDPVAGVRRQSEWDDHGESYSSRWEGPNINVSIKIPEGANRVSAYFFNKDGHSRKNRFRDLLITMYKYNEEIDLSKSEAPLFQPDKLELLGRARVCDFWGGVYKQFIFPAPGDYLLRIEKNSSFNTIVSGVFIDKIAGPTTYFDDLPMAFFGQVKFSPPKPDEPNEGEEKAVKAARELWDAAAEARSDPAKVHFSRYCQLMACRTALAANVDSKLAQNWRWHLGLWTIDDRLEFARTVDAAWARESVDTPGIIWQKVRRPQYGEPASAKDEKEPASEDKKPDAPAKSPAKKKK
jgi:hypothetical protein